jgi:hypothetical protein
MASAKPAWWLTVDGQSYGPYDLRTMQGYIAEGRVTGDSIVCRVGDQAWTPARGDTLLFRGGAAAPPPFAGSGAPAGGMASGGGAAAPVLQPYDSGAADAGGVSAPVLGNGMKMALAVLGAALVGLFFLPWVDVPSIIQASGFDVVRIIRSVQAGNFPMLPGMAMPGIPGMPPGQRIPVQIDLGWRAYQVYLLVLVPLAGCAVFATALAGLRVWRAAAIACGVIVWGVVAVVVAQAADSGLSWSQMQDSLRYLSYGFYGTVVVGTVIMILGFTRA